MSLKYNKKLIPRARLLRKNATPQEKHLWYDFLADYPIRFQRQKVIGNYIVDFYCAKTKLVIELDGLQHYEEEGLQYDAERTAYLEGFGLTVVRILNNDIDNHFKEVCEYIDHVIKESVQTD